MGSGYSESKGSEKPMLEESTSSNFHERKYWSLCTTIESLYLSFSINYMRNLK